MKAYCIMKHRVTIRGRDRERDLSPAGVFPHMVAMAGLGQATARNLDLCLVFHMDEAICYCLSRHIKRELD